MFDHVGLKARDLAASVKFYRAALAGLGHVVATGDGTYVGIGPPGAPALWIYAVNAAITGGTHVAFSAATRAAVDQFHGAGLAAGGRDNGSPGLRADYGANYYAAFLIDPDGNNVEAVCHAAGGD